MTVLRTLLERPDEPSPEALRLAAATDLERVATDVFPIEELAEESRRLLRARPDDLQLWCSDMPSPVSTRSLDVARGAVVARSVWGRVFAVFSQAAALSPAVRELHLAIGVQARIGPAPLRMFVSGSELALVALGDDGHRVDHPKLVADLRDVFVRAWRRSDPIGDEPAGNDVLEVVRLLTSGFTDEAAAARMDVSLRTYRRRIRELLDSLGVTSRFAAGVEADRRGLVSLAEALGDAEAPTRAGAPEEPGAVVASDRGSVAS